MSSECVLIVLLFYIAIEGCCKNSAEPYVS